MGRLKPSLISRWQPPARRVLRTSASEPEEVPAREVEDPPKLPIDLPTALRLADASNLQVVFAREQVNLALGRLDQANALWLPSIQAGGSYNHHDGAIQRVEGTQILTSRSRLRCRFGRWCLRHHDSRGPGAVRELWTGRRTVSAFGRALLSRSATLLLIR